MKEDKYIRLYYSCGTDMGRPDCYSDGCSERLFDVPTMEPVYVVNDTSDNEDTIILVGDKLGESSSGYNAPGISLMELCFTYQKLILAGLSNNKAVKELLTFYEATPLFDSKPSGRHTENWQKKFTIPERENDRVISEGRALSLLDKKVS